MKTEDKGRRLNSEWGINAMHALYSKTGRTYDHLKRFPGALLDDQGYVVFDTKRQYENSAYLHINKKVSVSGGIGKIPNYKSKPKSKGRRILFARIGHMIGYRGPRPPEDAKPIGGGSYNKKEIGHEVYNFKVNSGKLYGYFQPYLKKNEAIQHARISLERIQPGFSGPELEDVLVIFMCKRPKVGGQAIVGWYDHATVYRNYCKAPKDVSKARMGFAFNIFSRPDDAVLLPTTLRPDLFPKGGKKAGRPGQANAFYLHDKNGQRDTGLPKFKWITKALEFVDTYDGINLLDDLSVEAIKDIEVAYEKAVGSATGQGIRISPEARKSIENLAMGRAQKYFGTDHTVTDVSSRKPFDLLCVNKKTGQELRVEVKGTQTKGLSVLLTHGEVKSARSSKSALYILHSVSMSGKGKKVKAGGGTQFVVKPWQVRDEDLKEITYSYTVPK